MFAYFWFALSPSWTKTPVPGIVSFAIGHGFSPCMFLVLFCVVFSLNLSFAVLLVVLVPKIVPSKYISTALGAHKSVCKVYPCYNYISPKHLQMEQTGSTLFQTLAGILLDSKKQDENIGLTTFQYLLNAFLSLNVLECGTIVLLAYLQYWKNLKRKDFHSRRCYSSLSIDSHLPDFPATRRLSQSSDLETPLLQESDGRYSSTDALLSDHPPRRDITKNKSEVRRGKLMAVICVLLVVSAWIIFMITAWYKLGQTKGRLH